MMKPFLILCLVMGSGFGGERYVDGVLMGPGLEIPSFAQQFDIIDSFPAAATDYSAGLGCDGMYLWNNESFFHWFARMDPTTGSIVNTFTPTIGNRDMCFDGEYLWASDWQTSSITQFDTSNCSVVATIYPPFSAGRPNGMAWDGTHLWVGEESGRIYQMTNHGDTVRSIPPPVYYSFEPRGLAFDGEFLWVGYQSSGLIYKVDTITGAVLETHAAPGAVPGQRFQQGLDFDGQYLWSTVGGAVNMIYKIDIGAVPIEENRQIVKCRSEFNIAPNPVVHRADITFATHHTTPVRLTVFDVSGRKAMTLVDQKLAPGTYSYTWHCPSQASGIYFALLQTGETTETRHLIKIKN